MTKIFFFILLLILCLDRQAIAEPTVKGKFIKIVYADNWAPISYREGNKVLGILPEKMDDLLSKQMGMQIEHAPVPWGRAQKMVEMGRADAFVTTPTPERLKYTYPSKSNVFVIPFIAVVKKFKTINSLLNDPDDLSKLKDYLFCDVLGNGWANYFYKDKPVKLHIVPTIKDCLNLLNAERVDAIIHAGPVLEHYIKELGLQNSLTTKPKASVRSPKFRLLVSKKSPLGENFIKTFDILYEKLKIK